MTRIQRSILLGIGLLLAVLQPVWGAVVQIEAGKDNTLFEDANGTLSSGIGPHVFSGQTGISDGTKNKRGLLWFDIAANIPAGATITSATLQLSMSRSPNVIGRTIQLRRVLQDWGEGSSSAAGGEGAPATTGDATWLHTFFNTDFWVNAGGDFSATVSASRSVTGIGSYSWGSTAEMVADVQSWLDAPGNNFGWLLLGDEGTSRTVKRFDSREHITAANRPLLTVEYIRIADLDNDGFINFVDYALFAAEWPADDCSAFNDWCNRADMVPVGNPDGVVDGSDLGEFVSHWLE
jgi:hypothetical protein